MYRKYFDRSDWERFDKGRFVETTIKDQTFKGYLSLFCLDQVNKTMDVTVNNKTVRVIDDGFKWLQFAPDNEHYVATAILNAEEKLVKWYIDIVKTVGRENGQKYYDDLYLDVTYKKHEELHLHDEDDLHEALYEGRITQEDYELAYETSRKLMNDLNVITFIQSYEVYLDYMKKSMNHNNALEGK